MDRLTAVAVTSAGGRGSSRPVVVATAAGPRLVKLRGAAQGTGPLVAEIIVAELAEALGFRVPRRSLISLPAEMEVADWDDELADLLAASVGINLGFDYLEGARELALRDAHALEVEIKAGILWLDRLVLNPDRTERNPNLLWWGERLWLIDHGAALGFQYSWPQVTEESPRQPNLMPQAHVFEGFVSESELCDTDARLASQLTREHIVQAVDAVPDTFLAVNGAESTRRRRRAAFAAYLWKRLKTPRPFIAARPKADEEKPEQKPLRPLTRL